MGLALSQPHGIVCGLPPNEVVSAESQKYSANLPANPNAAANGILLRQSLNTHLHIPPVRKVPSPRVLQNGKWDILHLLPANNSHIQHISYFNLTFFISGERAYALNPRVE